MGRSCTITAEPDWKVVRKVVKTARDQGARVKSRQYPLSEAQEWMKKLQDIDNDINDVLEEEKRLKTLSIAERDLKRAENLIVHEDEIKSRPRRTWFESEKDKHMARAKGAAELNGPGVQKSKKKLSGKDRKKLELRDTRTEGQLWKKGKEDRGKPGERGTATSRGKSGKPGSKGKGGREHSNKARKAAKGSKR